MVANPFIGEAEAKLVGIGFHFLCSISPSIRIEAVSFQGAKKRKKLKVLPFSCSQLLRRTQLIYASGWRAELLFKSLDSLLSLLQRRLKFGQLLLLCRLLLQALGRQRLI